MKSLLRWIGAGVFLLLSFIVSSFPANASAKHPEAAQASFEGSPAWEKLDLRMREAWRASLGSEEAGKKVLECIIKTDRAVSQDDRATLELAGFKARTVIGKIVTGSVPARRVPDLAAVSFVSAIELAVPLELKKP
jgi:hypothetical protein